MKKTTLAIIWISVLFSCANAMAQSGVGFGTTSPTALIHMKDGHIKSEQTTLPTLAITTANGILGAALDISTSNPTDIRGTINITGSTTGSSTAVVTVTLKSIYSVPPIVVISPANSAATQYQYWTTSAVTAGVATFALNIIGNVSGPSFNYIVIE